MKLSEGSPLINGSEGSFFHRFPTKCDIFDLIVAPVPIILGGIAWGICAPSAERCQNLVPNILVIAGLAMTGITFLSTTYSALGYCTIHGSCNGPERRRGEFKRQIVVMALATGVAGVVNTMAILKAPINLTCF